MADEKQAPKGSPGRPKSKTAEEREQELQKKIRELEKQNAEKDIKLKSLDRVEAVEQSDEMQAVVQNLTSKIEELEKAQKTQQTFVPVSGDKPKYRPVAKEDVLPKNDAVTFSARSVCKVVPGYMDDSGMEVVAPHKMIVFKFAAADIKRDGKEENIINFCTYTTNLQTEIDFLRNHPEYGVTFSENMNDVATHDVAEYQFKVKAAEMVASMSLESLYSYLESIDLPNKHSMTPNQIRQHVIANEVKAYKEQAQELNDSLRNRLLEQAQKAKL